MQARVLGPLEVDVDGRRVVLAGTRQKAVLAALLLHANTVLPTEQLLVELWGDDASRSAANALQAAVSRLRKVLPPDRLVTQAPGYVLRVAPDELDVDRFHRLTARGRTELAASAPAQAAQSFTAALSLWRGQALADFRYEPFAQHEITRLEELRLSCVEDRIDADLAVGAGGGLVAELRRLVTDHPTREHLRGQQMLALYRSGRQQEALQAFEELRQVLAEELGLEPSPALARLQTAVLRQDPALDDRGPAPAPVVAPALTRRLVTVLTVELRARSLPGPDGATPVLDPETRRAVHARARALVAPVVALYGGTALPADDASIVATFGVTSVHEDDALRAVRTASDVGGLLASEATALRAAHRIEVTWHTAVASTEALVGTSDAGGFTGETAALSARLATSAAPRQIFLNEEARQLAGTAVDVRPDGAGGYLVESVLTGARPLTPRLDAHLAGRDAELATLRRAAADSAQLSASMLVTLVGEPGIGKSRLVHELVRTVDPDTRVLSGRCLPYGEAITYWPVREIVRQATGGSESVDALLALMEDESDSATVATTVAAVLGSEPATAPQPAEIFWAVRRLLESLARDRPLIVVFDDVQWGQATLLDLVESLALQSGGRPVTVVAVCRPELFDGRPAWAATVPRHVRVDLAPLSSRDARAMLESFVGDRNLSEHTLRRLCEVASGNPLFLEQLAISLGRQELPGRRDGRLAVGDIPPTIQALLAARLEQLGPAEREVLACAAVIGEQFSLDAVRTLLPEPGANVDRHLEALVAKGLVQRDTPTSSFGEEYAFRHLLIQQVTYRAVPKAQRAALHERFALWLEHRPRSGAVLHEVLGHHLEQAVRYRTETLAPADGTTFLARRAGTHLRTAGVAAHARGDSLAAVNLLRRAAALATDEPLVHAGTLVDLGAALTETGAFDEAGATLDDAVAHATAYGDERLAAHATLQRLARDLQVDPHDAAPRLDDVLPRATETFARAGDDLGQCEVLMLRASASWNRALSEPAERAWEEAARHARAAGHRRHLADCLGFLASAALWGPTPAPEAIRRCQRYLTEIGDLLTGRAMIMANLAVLHAMRRDGDRARSLLSTARAIAQDVAGTTTSTLLAEPAALVALMTDDTAEAQRLLRAGYEWLLRAGEKAYLATAAAFLAHVVVTAGGDRHDEVERLVETSREAGRDLDLSARILGDGALARSRAARGCHDEARRLAERAVACARTTDLTAQHADALLDLAFVLRRAGDRSAACEAAGAAVRLFEAKGDLHGLGRARSDLALI